MTPQGEAIVLYTMTNTKGESVQLSNFGAAIVAINVADKDGKIEDVALGYTRWQDYVSDGPAAGKSVGRYANRIARGRFTLEGTEYRLAVNNGPNHLHGGPSGFQNRVWQSRVEGGSRVVMSYVSAAGEEGYPAELGVEVCFDWDDNSVLELTYMAGSDGPTIVNMTNHVYFNLKGDGEGTIEDHYLRLHAKEWLPTDSTQIPTGEIASVEGTPMDFTSWHTLGSRINDEFEALKIGKGYDHCWAIDSYKRGRIHPAAELYEPTSGRKVTIVTSQPGIQVYTGNWLSGSPMGKHGEYQDRSAVALECQAFPDSPNKPNFPSCALHKGQLYEQHIIYRFTAESSLD